MRLKQMTWSGKGRLLPNALLFSIFTSFSRSFQIRSCSPNIKSQSVFFLRNILNYFRYSAQRMNIHTTCSVQGNNLGRAFIFAHSWTLNTNWEVPSLKHSIHLRKSPQDRWSMTPLPCLWFLPRSLLLSHLPQFWSAHAGSAGRCDEPGTEVEEIRNIKMKQKVNITKQKQM